MICFADTNIFIYAFDDGEDRRHVAARRLLDEIAGSTDKECVVSYQVIQEYCNVMLKKGIPAESVNHTVATALVPVAQNTALADYYARVLDLAGRYSLSFCDACIVQSALDLKCEVLYTEDLQDGQRFGGLTVVNPFA